MYTAAFFATLLAGSALAEHPVQSLMKRQQLTPDIIPAACQDTCQSALPIYNACLSGDQATCLSVCESDNFDAFVGCFNCIIQSVPGASSSDFQSAQQAIGDIEAACQQVGSSVSASGLETGAASASATGTGAGASFTSASSAIVIGGSSLSEGLSSAAGSATGATTSAPSSQTSAPSASGSGAAATSSAPNAGSINAPQGLAALVLGAIGALAL